jgi:hypothetical protein
MRGGDDAKSAVGEEEGTALVVALMAVTLLAALGSGLLLASTTELRIAAAHRDGLQAIYAAEAVTELVLAEFLNGIDIDAALAGVSQSSFVDGPSAGQRRVGLLTVDLTTLTNVERCGAPAGCGPPPAGSNAPWWQPYAHGWLHDAAADPTVPRVYVIAWIGDDASENDGDPFMDGDPVVNPGGGIAVLRVHAYSAAGPLRRIEVLVGGLPDGPPRLLSWTEGSDP